MPWTNHRVADTILRQMEAQRRRFGARIKALRKERGWSQEDAAHEVGVGVKTWRLWEGGKTTPYDANIRKLAKAFDIAPDELIEPPDAPLGLGAAPPEASLAVVLAAIKDQLAGQTAVLNEIKDLLDKNTASAIRIEAATKRVDAASRTLAVAAAETGSALRSGTRRRKPAASKPVPKGTPGA